MKLLHTADWHVGKTLRGRSRASEHEAVLQEVVELAKKNNVDIVIVAGDLFDSSAPTSESEKIVYKALLGLARAAQHVVIISGNHDNPRRLEAIKPFLELTNIHTGATLERPDEGGVIELKTESGETAEIALFPFLSQKGIVKADELMTQEAFEHAQIYDERAGRIIEHLCKGMSNKAVRLFVGHAMLHGGKLGGGERSAHTVNDYSVSTTALPASLHYAAMGHLHREQKLPGRCPIYYSGSPLQLDFGETEDVKSVNIVTAEAGKPAKVEKIKITKGKRLRTVRGTVEEIDKKAKEVEDDYLRVILKSMPMPGLVEQMREKLPNTIDIRIEKPEVMKIKGQEIVSRQGRSPTELFSEYLNSIGEKNEDVEKLFSELLEEAHASD